MLERDKEMSILLARLIEARCQAGLSQEGVASKIAIWRPTLSIVEAGKQTLTVALYLDLCRLYNVDPSQLMFGLIDEWLSKNPPREPDPEQAPQPVKKKGKGKKQAMFDSINGASKKERGE